MALSGAPLRDNQLQGLESFARQRTRRGEKESEKCNKKGLRRELKYGGERLQRMYGLYCKGARRELKYGGERPSAYGLYCTSISFKVNIAFIFVPNILYSLAFIPIQLKVLHYFMVNGATTGM